MLFRFAQGYVICGLLLALGCGKTPTPEQICTKLDKLEAKSAKAKSKSDKAKKKERASCIKDMTRLKKKKPEAYKCVAKCVEQDSYDEAMGCYVGCILKHTTDKEKKAAAKESKKELDALCKTDWSGRALHAVTDAVDGIGFSLQIPTGLKREERKAKGAFPGYVTWSEAGMCGPGFTVQVDDMPPSSLDSISTFMPNKRIVLKKAVEGGFLVVVGEKGNQYLEVKIYRKSKSGKVLRLSMGQRSDKLPAIYDKQRAWLQQVAATFQAK